MSGTSPVRFRPTSRQVLGRAVRIGLLVAVVVAIPVVLLAARGVLLWIEVALVPVVAVAGALLATPLARRGGIDLDEVGVHPVLPGAVRREYAPWHRIKDIRAERRGTRTVPVIYLDSGKTWRLRVPYDGPLLGGDPHFDEKVCTLRQLWETYHSWQKD
ncbi:MAG TPA: hypothetical protein VE172_10525 [Stackebrandtia sp.]|uniref:hypothetical protein n=1 Tax=Stackebrandtia sp. TaxID=2023065 RepID=UPI002D5AE40C|nr:hypothetical protein [Stackebrandtia sp.]HZE39234.1 hypothetical protein [Stackebrandtia sp.]